jgi:site-specific DNA recombinase
MQRYDEEQVQVEEQVKELERKVSKRREEKTNARRFVTLLQNHQNIKEVTDDMLYELIDKIVVHAPNGKHGIT